MQFLQFYIKYLDSDSVEKEVWIFDTDIISALKNYCGENNIHPVNVIRIKKVDL